MTLLVLLAVLFAPRDDIQRAIDLTNALRLDDAETIARRVHAEEIACDDVRTRAAALDVLGRIYFDLFADARRARAEYQRGLALRSNITARLYNNLGNVALSESDYAAAINAYDRALRASRKANEDRKSVV